MNEIITKNPHGNHDNDKIFVEIEDSVSTTYILVKKSPETNWHYRKVRSEICCAVSLLLISSTPFFYYMHMAYPFICSSHTIFIYIPILMMVVQIGKFHHSLGVSRLNKVWMQKRHNSIVCLFIGNKFAHPYRICCNDDDYICNMCRFAM